MPPAWRSPRTLGAAGLILALLMLLAFHRVLVHAVERADVREAAWANRVYAMQRCTSLPHPELRVSCRARADAGVVPPEPPLEAARLARLE